MRQPQLPWRNRFLILEKISWADNSVGETLAVHVGRPTLNPQTLHKNYPHVGCGSVTPHWRNRKRSISGAHSPVRLAKLLSSWSVRPCLKQKGNGWRAEEWRLRLTSGSHMWVHTSAHASTHKSTRRLTHDEQGEEETGRIYAQPEQRCKDEPEVGSQLRLDYTLRNDSNTTPHFLSILPLSKGCNTKILFIRHGGSGHQSLWESKMFTSGVCQWELGLNVRMDSRQPTAWLREEIMWFVSCPDTAGWKVVLDSRYRRKL